MQFEKAYMCFLKKRVRTHDFKVVFMDYFKPKMTEKT